MLKLGFNLQSTSTVGALVSLNWIYQDIALAWRLNLADAVDFTDTINF